MSIINLVANQTETDIIDWEFMDGPTTGVGDECWLLNATAQLEVYAVLDQGELVTCEVMDLLDM